MIAGIGVLLWACLFLASTYLMWKSIAGYTKVYLLIAFSALFLIGVFVVFPYLKGFKELRIVDFKKSAWPGIVSSAQGLSFSESWGTWSSSGVVTLEFAKHLPEKFTVHLVAQGFGPNVGKEFVAHVGDSAVRFTLAASLGERVLEFSNPKGSKIIKIDVPSPCSPKELGLSADERTLGIGLAELRIEPL